jgi:hypothetical protein
VDTRHADSTQTPDFNTNNLEHPTNLPVSALA